MWNFSLFQLRIRCGSEGPMVLMFSKIVWKKILLNFWKTIIWMITHGVCRLWEKMINFTNARLRKKTSTIKINYLTSGWTMQMDIAKYALNVMVVLTICAKGTITLKKYFIQSWNIKIGKWIIVSSGKSGKAKKG